MMIKDIKIMVTMTSDIYVHKSIRTDKIIQRRFQKSRKMSDTSLG